MLVNTIKPFNEGSMKTLSVARCFAGSRYYITPCDLANAVNLVDERIGKVLKDHHFVHGKYPAGVYTDAHNSNSVSAAYKDALCDLTSDSEEVMRLAELYSSLNNGGEPHISPLHILLATLDWDAANYRSIFQTNPPNPQIYFELKRAVLNKFINRLEAERPAA